MAVRRCTECGKFAASIGGDTVIQRLEECLLELAGRELIPETTGEW